MKNTFGTTFQITIFGESHGESIGVVIDGIPAGIALDFPFIQKQMNKRKPRGKISTQRHEEDNVHLVSGFFEGYTTGSPLCILIENHEQQSKHYEEMKYIMRPSHADYTAHIKYNGYQDYRGGGHFSGRITAPLVAAGAIALQILKEHHIHIATHILQCHTIQDESFSSDEVCLQKQLQSLKANDFPALQDDVAKKMIHCIEQTAMKKDSVGGILESIITGVPAGLGEPFFDSLESTLSHLLFSVPGIKGVEFGLGFSFTSKMGSEANDCFYYDHGIKTKSNHNGGINGGISNGMPILIKSVVKPTSSIFQQQATVNIQTCENTSIQIEGRHDPAIIHRACVVVDSVLAIGILDSYMQYITQRQMQTNQK